MSYFVLRLRSLKLSLASFLSMIPSNVSTNTADGEVRQQVGFGLFLVRHFQRRGAPDWSRFKPPERPVQPQGVRRPIHQMPRRKALGSDLSHLLCAGWKGGCRSENVPQIAPKIRGFRPVKAEMACAKSDIVSYILLNRKNRKKYHFSIFTKRKG